MHKKLIYQILIEISSALILGIVGWLLLTIYGGNNCDQTIGVCKCFCCHIFSLRGYESCGIFGFFSGALIGILLGILIVRKKFRE